MVDWTRHARPTARLPACLPACPSACSPILQARKPVRRIPVCSNGKSIETHRPTAQSEIDAGLRWSAAGHLKLSFSRSVVPQTRLLKTCESCLKKIILSGTESNVLRLVDSSFPNNWNYGSSSDLGSTTLKSFDDLEKRSVVLPESILISVRDAIKFLHLLKLSTVFASSYEHM